MRGQRPDSAAASDSMLWASWEFRSGWYSSSVAAVREAEAEEGLVVVGKG